MAINVQADHMRDVASEEDRGALVSLRRACHVTGITDGDIDIHNSVMTALDNAGLTYGSSITNYDNLLLVRRSFEADTPTQGFAFLDYESFGRAQLNYTIQGGSSLRQITSRVDGAGFAITVSNGGVTQGGEIDVDYPQTTITASALAQDESPWVTSHLWEARLNDKVWGGAPRGTVMVTSVNFELIDAATSPPTWYFTYEFAFDLTGWQPQVYYTDPSTGRPGTGLVQGVGYKTVGWYPYRDFNELFELEL